MDQFECPNCRIITRPAAIYVSRGKTWWSVSPHEAALYGDLCRHRETWSHGRILGCPSMRTAIDPRLWPDTETPRGDTTDQRTDEVSIADVATASYVIEARGDVLVRHPPMIADSFRDPVVRTKFQGNPGAAEVKSFDLSDVTLIPTRLLLFQDGRANRRDPVHR